MGQILLMTPVPSLNQAYFLLLQEENQRDSTVVSYPSPDITAMSVRHTNFSKNSRFIGKKSGSFSSEASGNHNVTCNYCHQDKHTRDECFFLHGSPPWHRLYGQPKPKLKSTTKHNANVPQVAMNSTHDNDLGV